MSPRTVTVCEFRLTDQRARTQSPEPVKVKKETPKKKATKKEADAGGKKKATPKAAKKAPKAVKVN